MFKIENGIGNKVKIDLDGEEGVGTLITIWMPLEYM